MAWFPEPPVLFYTPEKLGPMCASGCGWQVPLALSNIGILTHPSCGPAKASGPRRRRR